MPRALIMRRPQMLLLALLLWPAWAELEDVVVSGKMNLLHYVAKELAASTKEDYVPNKGVPQACAMEPPHFFPDINFYVLECLSDMKAVTVNLHGTNNFFQGQQVNSFDVVMPHTEDPQIKTVVSCPDGVGDPNSPECTQFTLDLFRKSSDIATLSSLGVSSKNVMYVTPPFDAGVQSFNTTVELGLPFSISARTEQPKGRVGILAPMGSGLEPSLNGCEKAAQRQTVWDLPGFSAVGTFTFELCAVAPDNIHKTVYYLNVLVKPKYSVKLFNIHLGGHKLEPAFDPEVQQYIVHVDGSVKEVQLELEAEDPEATMRVSADKETIGFDNLTTMVQMHDNNKLEVGEPPQWSREVSIELESADGERTMTYMVDVKQQVSNYSYLKNLSIGNTKCKMDPPQFILNHTQYKCVFWWTETKAPEIIATMDTVNCPDCILLVPSPREFPKSHLSLQYQTQKKRVFKSDEVWSRDFLYGEYHTVPFQVLSADKFTHTTYEIYLERDAPWWMRTATTRAISSWATTLATVLAATSASNFVALARQIQFMDLTTEIQGTPDVYNQFSQHLKAFNFDFTQYLPDMGLPSFEDVQEYRGKVIEQLQDSMHLGQMKTAGTLVLQYCYALTADPNGQGRLAANAILAEHPKGTADLIASLKEMQGSVFSDTKKAQVLDDAAVAVEQKAGNISRLLRGVKHYPGDVSGDPKSIRRLEEDVMARRLGDEDSALLVVEWTDRQWEKFIKDAIKKNVSKDAFQTAFELVPCDTSPMREVVPFLYLMHEMELIRRMMHSYTGTFLLMFLFVTLLGGSYIAYYQTVMKSSQRRLRMLEPGFLSIFVLDMGLIGFTRSAAKMLTQNCLVTFFFWKPERFQIQIFVAVGILMYPVLFVLVTCWMIWDVTIKDAGRSADETDEVEIHGDDLHTKMVFNEDIEQWIDPAAKEIKVTLEPPIPSWVLVASDALTSHVRSCIPVLTEKGEAISFKHEHQEKVKEAQHLNRANLEEEADQLEEKLNASQRATVTKRAAAMREERAKKIHAEKELHERLRNRSKNHKSKLEAEIEEVKKQQELYGAKDLEGPTGSPPWFPENPEVVAEDQKLGEEEDALVAKKDAAGVLSATDEGRLNQIREQREKLQEDEVFEDFFEFTKVNMAELMEEWTLEEEREDCEELDAEEAYAIRAYLEGQIRREKRLTKYNILKVSSHKGYLLPREPFLREIKAEGADSKDKKGKGAKGEKSEEVTQELDPSTWWFPEDGKLAPGVQLDEFKDGKGFIANSTGQRLIYDEGGGGCLSRFFGRMKVGNQEAGYCYWMDEPENGWESFDAEMGKQDKPDSMKTTKHFEGKRYADKWQWIYLDKWDLPWSGDDKEEKELRLCWIKTVQKDDIPLFRMAEKGLMKSYKNYVPKQITDDEKLEIRKWVWQSLLEFAQLKLMLAWVSKKHPKYYKKSETMADILEKSFDEFLLDLAHKEPEESQMVDGEQHHNTEELLQFSVMKFEELFPDDEEPWWDESDKPDKTERKVMFDHGIFFEDSGVKNGRFHKRREENDLIPEHGYCSSTCFTRFPNDTFGKKRYVLKKPDDPVESIARVEMKLQLRHVLPLMRYTSAFKACVPINSLELPLRSNLQIILKESGKGEQFNYTVDRVTNMISIGVLASNPPGPICAATLLSLQLMSFANRFYTNYTSAVSDAWLEAQKEQEKEEAAAAEGEDAPEAPLVSPTKDQPEQRKSVKALPGAKKGKKKKTHKLKTLTDAFLEIEVFKLFMQSMVLFILCLGQFGFMPGPLCAIGCIITCCVTMIVMNIGTFRKEINKQIESLAESLTEMYRMIRSYQVQALNWLNGENRWGYKFIETGGEEMVGMENVTDVSFVVPELGLRLQGKATVDDLLPADEKLKQQLLKYTAYFANVKEDEKNKVGCASDLMRYYQDISSSFTIALSIDQLKLCKPIAPLAATLQCVNHAGSSISSPDFDSYLTLHYPEEWDEEENDKDKDAVHLLLEMWKAEVKAWFDNSLGAVYSDRTFTKRIQDHIAALMGTPFESDKPRNCVMVKVDHILIPRANKHTSCRQPLAQSLKGKKVYVTVLYENEDFLADLPPDRSSPFAVLEEMNLEIVEKELAHAKEEEGKPTEGGRLYKFNALLEEEGDEDGNWNDASRYGSIGFWCYPGCEFKVPIPPTVSKFKLMVWAQHTEPDGKHVEELLGISESFDLMLPEEDQIWAEKAEDMALGTDMADQKRLPIFTSWHADSRKGLVRIKEDDEGTEAITGCFAEQRKRLREYFYPTINKLTVHECTGFVDVSVRPLTKEEKDEDHKMLDAAKDVVVGASEMNKSKLRRHLDRRPILAKFFGMRMHDECFQHLKSHLERLKKFKVDNNMDKGVMGGMVDMARDMVSSGRQNELQSLLYDADIRRSLWKEEEMDAAIACLEQALKEQDERSSDEKSNAPIENYRIQERWRGQRRFRITHKEETEEGKFEATLLEQLKTFKKAQSRGAKSILHYVIVADHLKPNKVWRPDAISPHICGIITNTMQDVPLIRMKCEQFRDITFFREQLSSREELPAYVNARLVFKAEGAEAAKFYERLETKIEYSDGWASAVAGFMNGKKTEDYDVFNRKEQLMPWTAGNVSAKDEDFPLSIYCKAHANKDKWMLNDGTGDYFPVWLYWDGFARWVISPKRGEPAPYGLKTDKDEDVFFYVKDAAITPDRVNSTWMGWNGKQWEEEPTIRALSKFTGQQKEEASRAQQLASHAKTVNAENRGSSLMGEVWRAITYIFQSTGSAKTSPEIKECLIGLEGGNIIISWKDIHQEDLAPLRKFLLAEFGSYYAAWVFLCRNCTITKEICVRNLAKMLKRCWEELEAAQHQRDQEKKKNFQAGKNLGAKKAEKEDRPANRSLLNRGDSIMEKVKTQAVDQPDTAGDKTPKSMAADESPKKKATLFASMFNKAKKAGTKDGPPMAHEKTSTSVTAAMSMGGSEANKEEKIMKKYLKEAVKELEVLEQLCQEIMDCLDHDGDGQLEVEEVLHLAKIMDEGKETNPKLKEFCAFLNAHPKYREVEHFWADLSEGFELSKEEFVRDSKLLLSRFNNQQKMMRSVAEEPMDLHARSEAIFSKLDVQMSGGISLFELIPMAGDTIEEADSNLVKFRIPLTFIKEIRIDASRAAGSEERLTVRFQVHPDFENAAEWRAVKKGLAPDWEPNPGFEYLQVAMVPQYLEMWKQVIKDCNMDSAQEFVRFYHGGCSDHPALDGVYMRVGMGVQRWPDGKTYKGEWEHHLYHGQGKLFGSYEDMTNDARPVYEGDWLNGKRHGNGELRWEQDNSETKRKTFGDRQFSGVRKVYNGEFRHDLFHGNGKMTLEKAVSQSLRTMDHQGMAPGKVPLPHLDPLYILSFEGRWESEWRATDLEAREYSALYANLHPVRQIKDSKGELVEDEAQRDLALDKVTELHMKRKDQKYVRYFSPDPLGVQAAGDPLPDLALAYYQMKGGDANHMKQGQAVYADFTEYEGEYYRGVPHGYGKMVQYDHQDGKKVEGKWLARYEGEWKDGKFHGKGLYETADGLKYTGQFANNLRDGDGIEEISDELALKIGYSKYEGQWKEGVFDGQGKVTYGDEGDMKRLFLEGLFEQGKRVDIVHVYGKAAESEDPPIKLRCKFLEDKVLTSKTEMAWARFDDTGKFFYGMLAQDGELGSWGTLYSHRAAEDETFMSCVKEGEPYKAENPEDDSTLKYTLYHGGWKDSMPDGFGVQHFEGAQVEQLMGAHGGTYTGDFLRGKRHGRGVWKTLQGAWEYRPIGTETVPNWENDLMHGIGIVEDSDHVHENVIYTKGKCQMPFTELGPPKTGFESAAFSEVMPQANRKRAFVTPLPTVWDEQENNPAWTALLKSFGYKLKKVPDEGWEALDKQKELRFLRATAAGFGASTVQGVMRTYSQVSGMTMGTMATTIAHGEPQAAALVREPTDLSLPEEDVLIKGGTGENEVLNGVYFKLMHTFGVKAFKMVKQTGFYSTPIVRYLYWDHVSNAWTISPKPLVGICLAAGCAFCQEEGTEHPSMVSKEWYVWHGYSGALLAYGDKITEEEEDEDGKKGFSLRGLMGPPSPVDKIEAKSIVGFQVQGSQDSLGNIGRGLMLRIPMTLFGRPVYEFEGGGQYLYFRRKEMKLADGQDARLEEFGAGVEPNPAALYEMEGYWAVSSEIGAELDSDVEIHGYVEDLGITPDQIARIWQVNMGSEGWKANPELRFVAQEWSHEGTLQAMTLAEKEKEKEAAAAAQ